MRISLKFLCSNFLFIHHEVEVGIGFYCYLHCKNCYTSWNLCSKMFKMWSILLRAGVEFHFGLRESKLILKFQLLHISMEKLILISGCYENHCENRFSDSRRISSPAVIQSNLHPECSTTFISFYFLLNVCIRIWCTFCCFKYCKHIYIVIWPLGHYVVYEW